MKSNKPLMIILVLALVCGAAFIAADMQKKKKAGTPATTAQTETTTDVAANDDPYVAPTLPDALMHEGKPIDALCLTSKAVNEGGTDIDLTKCVDEGVSSTKSDKFNLQSGFIGTEFTREGAKPEEYPSVSYAQYKYLGEYNSKPTLFVEWATGQGPVLTGIYAVERPEPNKLVISERLYGGGDRCNAGLTDAIVEDGKIAYAFNVTPFNFFLFGGHNPDGLQPVLHLASGPVDCYGKAIVQNGMLTKVELKEGMASLLAAKGALPESMGGTMQKCFDGVLSEKATAGNVTYDLAALNAFAKEFVEKCPKPADPPMPPMGAMGDMPGLPSTPAPAETPAAPAAETPAAEPAPAPAAEETAPAAPATP